MPNPFGAIHYDVSQPYGPTSLSAEPTFRGYLHYHCGIDIVAEPWNAPIYSICQGSVFAAGTDTDGANYVIVFDGTDKYFAYWHLSAITVSHGQQVYVGTQLGNQGYTGNVVPQGPGGSHLHLEIQQKNPYGQSLHNPNNCIDPTPYLDAQGGASDMDIAEVIKAMYRVYAGREATDDEIQEKAGFINNSTDNLVQVMKDVLTAGADQCEPANIWALQAYANAREKAGVPYDGGPSKYAWDRWAGGAGLSQVMDVDMAFWIGRSRQLDTLLEQDAPEPLTDDQKADLEAMQALKSALKGVSK